MIFLHYKLLCYKLGFSSQEKLINIFKSILMQANSISAKIAILSLI